MAPHNDSRPKSALAYTGNGAPQLLTLEQVVKRLAVSPRTGRRLIDGGELPHVRVGHSVRVSEQDLAEFIARNRYAGGKKRNNKEFGDSTP